MFETIMIYLSIFVIGFLEICFITGFLQKVLNFNLSIKGLPVWLVSFVLGWVTFKLIGLV